MASLESMTTILVWAYTLVAMAVLFPMTAVLNFAIDATRGHPLSHRIGVTVATLAGLFLFAYTWVWAGTTLIRP